ncbi:FadR/GntR family transcriptional regulator [Actinomadura sp. 6N118]|uniref:FadR/GntR family transcriptional regulator n=1 Tax=Actinomadura sp. 6N118 TaxID=3375151 RepID=UPI0037AD93B5
MTTVEHSLRTLLQEGLRSGALGPGAKLPTERALVDRLAAPRNAIRRALETLEQEGLIVRQVGRGTFLTDATAPPTEAAPADTSPTEIMQVRLLIEPPVAALAARVATQADLDRIAHCLDRGGRSDGYQDFETWDTRLHHAIAQAAHNGLLMSIFDVMNTARALPIWGSLKRRTSTPERLRCYHTEHSAIVEALRDRDPESAQDTMRRHLQNVADNLLGRH